jgi:outer membrane protein OmpA-like peptidoglycan-associated protein/ABC-type amino acid transport substrate-binding protein
MNKGIALGALIIGLIALAVVKFFAVEESTELTVATSDAQGLKENVRIGMDNWMGYYLLCSKHFKSSLRNQGIRSTCENDNADLQNRFAKLKKGELDFAVTTIDAYLALGADYTFPGTIVMVIDESKGGDALLAWEDTVSSIDELKNNPALRVALTQDSPSEHLVRSLAVHFDVANFKRRGDWLVSADGSEDSAKKLLSKQVDAAVLWEPDVTKALQTPGIKKIIGTEDTERLIVDVLLVNRKFAKNKPQVVEAVMNDYFDSLKFYQQNPDNLVKELRKETGLKSGAIQSMLKGVAWVSLTDNAYDWFSTISQSAPAEYLMDTIESSMSILTDTGVLSSNPLPDQNPYSITQSKFIEQLFDTKIGEVPNNRQEAKAKTFSLLDGAAWEALREVGTLKVRKVTFARSSGELSLAAKEMLDHAAQDLAHYPNYRIMVKGHTGLGGDKAANKSLSQDRADAVSRYLNITHGINENRVYANGVGSEEPLARLPDENRRAYKYRLPRVELILKSGAL